MSRDLQVMELDVVNGEIVPEAAVLDAQAMCSMNFARLEHQRLNRLIQTFSGNYCLKHRHIGAASGEVGKRPGDEECEQ